MPAWLDPAEKAWTRERQRAHRRDWLNCIRSRKKPIADVEIGARSVTVCHLGNLAYWNHRTLRWDPKNFPANLLLGRMYLRQQKAAEAIPLLQKAAKLHPDAIDPHRLLADAYTQLGREDSANRELSEAQRIQGSGGSRLGTPTEDSEDK